MVTQPTTKANRPYTTCGVSNPKISKRGAEHTALQWLLIQPLSATGDEPDLSHGWGAGLGLNL